MNETLRMLLEKAKSVRMTPEQWEEQRRSFAHGNAAFENPNVTRAMIDDGDRAAKPHAFAAGDLGRLFVQTVVLRFSQYRPICWLRLGGLP
ncbi:MAG: hypothetical protein LDL44_14580 [Caenispirillum sp.]|nr:hypothetical protein [Caenispirillum sp.]